MEISVENVDIIYFCPQCKNLQVMSLELQLKYKQTPTCPKHSDLEIKHISVKFPTLIAKLKKVDQRDEYPTVNQEILEHELVEFMLQDYEVRRIYDESDQE